MSPGVKNKEVDYLSLKYDLMLKFPCQWPETKFIEKLVLLGWSFFSIK